MAEIHYLISDASRKVDVEAHVLRYWEEELELSIPRTEMGHRYYTEYHIHLFQQVKSLKEKGYQLKAIKAALDKMLEDSSVVPDEVLEEDLLEALKNTNLGQAEEPELDGEALEAEFASSCKQASEKGAGLETDEDAGEEKSADSGRTDVSAFHAEELEALLAGEKMEQFQKLMNHIIGRAMEENSEKLSQDISYLVHDKLMKEMEYLMRVSDEREEERFKRLDESIRFCQRESQGRAEAAVSVSRFPFLRLKKKKFGRSGNKL